MKKEYKYSNLKQETNTSGKVMLEPSKKTKKRKPRAKPPRISNRQILERIFKRLDKQDDFNKVVLNFIKQQQEFNKQTSTVIKTIIKVNNLKTE